VATLSAVNRGLLQVLFGLLLLVVTSTPAAALCRPENRVGVFSEKPSVFASQEVAKPIGTPSETPACGYDFASGVHKYLYAQGDPIDHVDPSGKSVYVCTRPLNIKGLENLGNNGCHVFLAFDSEGMDLNVWENLVRESCDLSKHPNSYGEVYSINASLVAFSFHPKSVLTGDESEQYYGTILTPSSYVAYSDAIDLNAFDKSGTGYNKWKVATGQEMQMWMYKDATKSRDKNNNGTPDPMAYEFTIFNCGSWVDINLARHGLAFPDKSINRGVGIAKSGTAASSTGYVINAAARLTRSVSHAVMDFISVF